MKTEEQLDREDRAILRVLRSLRLVPLVLGIALLGAYAGDALLFLYRVHANTAYSQVQVTSYIAVPEKGQKTEFFPPTVDQQTCVNALFPHRGFNPCWYVRRHADDRQNI